MEFARRASTQGVDPNRAVQEHLKKICPVYSKFHQNSVRNHGSLVFSHSKLKIEFCKVARIVSPESSLVPTTPTKFASGDANMVAEKSKRTKIHQFK